MANSTSLQVILDGPRNCVVKFEGVLDSSDLSLTTVIEPSFLQGMDNTGTLKASDLRITKIHHNIEDGLILGLFWESDTPRRIGRLFGRSDPNYSSWGGIPNDSGFTGERGIQVSSSGWSGVKSFALILELTKGVYAGAVAPPPGPDLTFVLLDELNFALLDESGNNLPQE